MDSREFTRRILIIDDDGDCRKLLLKWLSSQFQGIEAFEYDPGKQGLPGKDFNWSVFDVLLLDYDLRIGDVTGLDILQENFDNLLFPVTIMLTGAGSEEVAVRALRSGVIDYLRKDHLKKEDLKKAIDNAFAQQTSKRQRFYTLNDALQVAKTESQRIIESYKTQYEQEREQEVKRMKDEMDKIQQELNKYQAQLTKLEQNKKNAEEEKRVLLAESQEQQPDASDKDEINIKLDSTLNELMKTRDSINSVQQIVKTAKAEIEKTQWKQEQVKTEQQEVENDLAILLEEKKKSEDAKAELRERLDAFMKSDTKKITPDEDDQKLFDEISSLLK